jgi:predicted metal-dependent hydrolase
MKEVGEVGEVLFVKDNKFRRLSIRIKNDQSITVQVPLMMSFKESELFLKKKIGWINKQKEKILKRKILKQNQMPSKRMTDKFIMNTTKKIFSLSLKHNLNYNRLNYKWMKSRWGSCSYNNNISLNLWMIFLPNDLINYIILHELVHTKIKNHSQEFWIKLEKICKNPKLFNKRLNDEYGI